MSNRHDERSYRETASNAVQAILDDISDRSGLQNAWDEIDLDIQDEIKEEWTKLVLQAMGCEV